MKLRFALLALPFALAACSTPKLTGTDNLQVVDGRALPPPSREDLGTVDRAYLIGSFDKLSVEVFGVGELSKTVQADASGRISLPLVGVVDAAGHTPVELAKIIE